MDGLGIRLRRVELGLGVAELAELVGVDVRTVRRWEHGDGLTSIKRVRDICWLFRCGAEEMGDAPGRWIRRGRLRRGLTQAELGELIGVHARVVSSWERGTHSLGSFVVVRQLCDALQWDIEVLYVRVGGV
jgi:transcriptional regulator with XRE-family HTH domain